MSAEKTTCDPASHKLHMCALKEKGQSEEMRKRSDNPRYVCGNCGAKANDASYVCKPKPL